MAEQGRYRVLPGPEPDTLRLLDRTTCEPAVVSTGGSEDESGSDDAGSGAPIGDLRPGYLVDAALDWTTQRPTVESVSVVRPTLFAFADGVDPMFEAARETWQAARSEGEAMNTQVLRNTDNEVTGAVYVFAESGERGRLEEFREGARPLGTAAGPGRREPRRGPAGGVRPPARRRWVHGRGHHAPEGRPTRRNHAGHLRLPATGRTARRG